MKKRLIAFLLVLIMVLGMLPASAFAADADVAPNDTAGDRPEEPDLSTAFGGSIQFECQNDQTHSGTMALNDCHAYSMSVTDPVDYDDVSGRWYKPISLYVPDCPDYYDLKKFGRLMHEPDSSMGTSVPLNAYYDADTKTWAIETTPVIKIRCEAEEPPVEVPPTDAEIKAALNAAETILVFDLDYFDYRPDCVNDVEVSPVDGLPENYTLSEKTDRYNGREGYVVQLESQLIIEKYAKQYDREADGIFHVYDSTGSYSKEKLDWIIYKENDAWVAESVLYEKGSTESLMNTWVYVEHSAKPTADELGTVQFVCDRDIRHNLTVPTNLASTQITMTGADTCTVTFTAADCVAVYNNQIAKDKGKEYAYHTAAEGQSETVTKQYELVGGQWTPVDGKLPEIRVQCRSEHIRVYVKFVNAGQDVAPADFKGSEFGTNIVGSYYYVGSVSTMMPVESMTGSDDLTDDSTTVNNLVYQQMAKGTDSWKPQPGVDKEFTWARQIVFTDISERDEDGIFTMYGHILAYKLTIDLDGGTLPAGTADPSGYYLSDSGAAIPDPVRPGFEFAGWEVTYDSGDGGNIDDGEWTPPVLSLRDAGIAVQDMPELTPIDGNMTMKATWISIVPSKENTTDVKVLVKCAVNAALHVQQEFGLCEGTYTADNYRMEGDFQFCDLTVQTAEYVKSFSDAYGVDHTAQSATIKFTLMWDEFGDTPVWRVYKEIDREPNVIIVSCEQPIYVYFKPVDSQGNLITGLVKKASAEETDKTLDRLKLTYNSTGKWFTFGKLKSAASTLEAVKKELADGSKTIERYSGNIDFAYGDQIVWKSLAMKPAGHHDVYNNETTGQAYHLDGDLTLYRTAFDTEAAADVTGMPEETYPDAFVYDYFASGEQIVMPAEKPNREGYTFKGWKAQEVNPKPDEYSNPATDADEDSKLLQPGDAYPVNGKDVVFYAQWEKNQTVKVVIYRNGNTEKAYKSYTLDAQPKGTVIDLTKLNIADYYTANNTGKYKVYGWYNDGTWNVYKKNPANPPAGLEKITVNGWTNIVAMVYDYETVAYFESADALKAYQDDHSKTDGLLLTTTALHGSALPTADAPAASRKGYKFLFWSREGQTSDVTGQTVNGWTNLYANWELIPPAADSKPSYSGLTVKVNCVENKSEHTQGAYVYGLVIGLRDYSGINEPESWIEENGEYFYTLTINKDVYIALYANTTKTAHTEVGENKTEVKWQWNGTKWVLLNEKGKSRDVLTINVKCEPKQTVKVVIYRNGDTETAYKTFSLDAQPKGTVIDLTKLNIADYYSANYTGKYKVYGWYNDGTWNVYKKNPANPPAGLEKITVNGWTNIIAMVYDYEKITVSTTLKDGTIYSGDVLRGTNVVDHLNGLSLDLDVPGYDIDADKDGNINWYKKDSPKHTFGANDTVQGWTNVLVKYSVIPHDIYAFARVNSAIAPLTKVEFDEPVTLNSTTLARLGLGAYNSKGYISIGKFNFNAMPLTEDMYFGDDAELSAVVAALAKSIELESIELEQGVSKETAEQIVWTFLFKADDSDYMTEAGYPTTDADGYQLSGNLDLAAVMFDADAEDAEGMPVNNYTYDDVIDIYDFYFAGDKLILPDDPTRAGYTFKGWSAEVLPAENEAECNDAESGTGSTTGEKLYKSGDVYEITEGGVKFTAQWEVIPHDIYAYIRTGDSIGDALTLNADTLARFGLSYNKNGFISFDAFVSKTLITGDEYYALDEDDAFLGVVGELKEHVASDAARARIADKTNWSWLYVPADVDDRIVGYDPTSNLNGYQLSGTLSFYGAKFAANGTGVTGMPETNYGGCADYYIDGEAVTMPAAPARAGYDFNGWKIGSTTLKAGQTYTVAGEDMVFTAQWTARNDTPYVVEHYKEQLDGTYTLVETDNKEGTTDTTVTAEPKTDYADFTYDSTVDGTVASGNIAGDGSLVLKLYYTRNKYAYTVKHIKQLPDGTYDEAHAEIEVMPEAKFESYAVVNAKNYGPHYPVNDAASKKNIPVVSGLVIEVRYDLDFHTLTFDTMGGSEIAPIKVRCGTVVPKPEDPTRFGCLFSGWYTTTNYTTEYDFSTPLTADITIYAKWTLIVLPSGVTKKTPKLNTTDHFAYVQGYPNGTVKPAGNITRAETAAILFRLMDDATRNNFYSTKSGFRDVAVGSWYNTYVATLNNAGVITDSTNGYFRPNEAITRAELAAMLAAFTETTRAANYFNDVTANYWAANAIAICAKLGWITGYPDGSFRPDKNVTRAELMAMINRATGRAPKSADAFLPGMKTWSDNTADKWYYLDVQEATNSHAYTIKGSEAWTALTADPNWSKYE